MKKEPSQALGDLEKKIVQLVAQGYRNREIAQELFLSEWTLNGYLNYIYNTLRVSDRLELILYGIVHGMAAQAAPEVYVEAEALRGPAAA